MRLSTLATTEDVLLLSPLKITPAPDTVLEVPISRKHLRWLQDKAEALHNQAETAGIKLRQKLTPEDLVRVLIHLYVCTDGWTDLLSIPDLDDVTSA